MKRSEAELMQYRFPVGAGPSSKTWPKWDPPARDRTSVRDIPKLSSAAVSTLLASIGLVKLGQPVPESNLSVELKGARPWQRRRTSRAHGCPRSCCETGARSPHAG